MSEHDDQWLRDGLAAAVPTPPEVGDRARGATAKARRGRRVRTVGVLGAAAVVVVGAVAWTVTSGDDDRATDPATNPPTVCPKPDQNPVDSSKATGEAGDGVPAGATSARLCQGSGTLFDGPQDPLLTGVTDLVATINGLTPYPASGGEQVCTADLGPGYQIVFGYPDGSTTVVTGEPYGCQSVAIGTDDIRTEPTLPVGRFVELLRTQRDASTPPTTTPAAELACDTTLSPVGRAAEMTEAVYCFRETGPAIPIPPDDLAVLVADMRVSEPLLRVPACNRPGRIVGHTAWGDIVKTSAVCLDDLYSLEGNLAWRVSPASKTILDRLEAEAN